MSQQTCPNCGEPRIGQFAFCRSCGHDYDAHAAAVPTKHPSRARPAVLVIGVSMILALVAVAGWSARSTDQGLIAQASTAPSPTGPTATALPTVNATASPVPAAEASATPSMSAVLSATDAPPPPPPPPPPLPATVALPNVSATVPGATKVRYFPVAGESPAALIDQTVAQSKPLCQSDDTLACVANSFPIRWITSTNLATGACRITSAKVSLKSVVSLPRWTGPSRVQPTLLAWWKEFSAHLAWHEGQHIAIQKTYDSKLKPLLVGHKCSSANGIIAKWERSLQTAQDEFDARDRSWPYPEYTGPGGFYGQG